MDVFIPSGALSSGSFITRESEAGLGDESTLGSLFSSGVAASRPAFGVAGRIYYATDSHVASLDTGTAWVDISTLDHADLLDVSIDQHHARDHALDAAVHTGTISDAGHGVVAVANAHGHGDLSSVTANQHHNQAHGVSDHTATVVEGDVGADVTMTNANQYYDGPSVSLTAGTWLLVGTITVVHNNSGADITAKLWNGTTVESSTEAHNKIASSTSNSLSLAGVVVLAGAETWKISAAADVATSGVIKAAAVTNGAGNNASHLRAVRLA